MLNRGSTGRVILTAGSALCIASGVYWLLRFPDQSVGYVAVLCTFSIIAAVFAWTPSATAWLHRPESGP